MMRPEELRQALTRRAFLTHSTTLLGSAALAALLRGEAGGTAPPLDLSTPGALPRLHFAPRAKRVIYLFMSGGPSHLDLFDPKPLLAKRQGEDLPASVRGGQRITGMTSGQARLQMVGAAHPFVRAAKAGTEIASILPHTAKVMDEICLIRSLHAEPINHDPAVTNLLT